MSQKQRILDYLKLNGKLCSFAPFDWQPSIRRVAARIHDLESEGHEIHSEVCRLCASPTRHVAYELIKEEARLF